VEHLADFVLNGIFGKKTFFFLLNVSLESWRPMSFIQIISCGFHFISYPMTESPFGSFFEEIFFFQKCQKKGILSIFKDIEKSKDLNSSGFLRSHDKKIIVSIKGGKFLKRDGNLF